MTQTMIAQRQRDRLFIGVFPGGISYCDTMREENHDYKKLAFLPFHSLKLEWRGECPEALRREIELSANEIIAQRGQPFVVSGSGQTIILGQ